MEPVFVRNLKWFEPVYEEHIFQELYEQGDLNGIFRTVIRLINTLDGVKARMVDGPSRSVMEAQMSIMRRDINRHLSTQQETKTKLRYLMSVGDTVQRLHNNILKDLLDSHNNAEINAAEMIAQEMYQKECEALLQTLSVVSSPGTTEDVGRCGPSGSEIQMNKVTGVKFECCPITKVNVEDIYLILEFAHLQGLDFSLQARFVNLVLAADGHTYEREAIEEWLQTKIHSPVTGEAMIHSRLVSNRTVITMMQTFLSEV